VAAALVGRWTGDRGGCGGSIGRYAVGEGEQVGGWPQAVAVVTDVWAVVLSGGSIGGVQVGRRRWAAERVSSKEKFCIYVGPLALQCILV
jgi:hypothetical protein